MEPSRQVLMLYLQLATLSYTRCSRLHELELQKHDHGGALLSSPNHRSLFTLSAVGETGVDEGEEAETWVVSHIYIFSPQSICNQICVSVHNNSSVVVASLSCCILSCIVLDR